MKKSVVIIIGGVVALIFLIIAITFISYSSSNKLICKSSIGNITLFHDETNITGFISRNIPFDKEGQKYYVTKVGLDKYLDEYQYWFLRNTDGSCERK